MNGTKPKSVTRYEQGVMLLARERLAGCPEAQTEAIARHYAAHANLAIDLLKMCNARQYGSTADLDAAISYLVDQIKTNHRNDFGIELEWTNNPPTEN